MSLDYLDYRVLFHIFSLLSSIGGLNQVLNLVVLSLTTIEIDLFRSVVIAICLRSSSIFIIKIFLFILIWYVEPIKSASILTAVFLTREINDYKTVVNLPSCFTKISEFFLSHIITHMILENVINILKVLRKQTDKICVLSNCLS